MTRKLSVALAVVGLAALAHTATAANLLYMTRGHVWSYWDKPEAPAPEWTQAGFDDADWGSGPSELGYGDNDEATAIGVGNGITTYYRTTLWLPDTANFDWSLVGNFDDGAVVYVNGVEAWRFNMPEGEITHDTASAGSVKNENSNKGPEKIDSSLLQVGDNTFAVEVHQVDVTSTDASMTLFVVGDPKTAGLSSLPSASMITAGQAWKYLDINERPPKFMDLDYNDGAWKSGRAELGFGDGDEATKIDARGVTALFRRKFVYNPTPDEADALVILEGMIKADDGAVMYLNGREGDRRENMPGGAVNKDTHALSGKGAPEESAFSNQPVYWAPTSLVIGENVVAVEVHQNNKRSNDMSFDFTLKAIRLAVAPSRSPEPTASNSPLPTPSVTPSQAASRPPTPSMTATSSQTPSHTPTPVSQTPSPSPISSTPTPSPSEGSFAALIGSGAIKPSSSGSDNTAIIVSACVLVGIGLAAAAAFFVWKRKQQQQGGKRGGRAKLDAGKKRSPDNDGSSTALVAVDGKKSSSRRWGAGASAPAAAAAAESSSKKSSRSSRSSKRAEREGLLDDDVERDGAGKHPTPTENPRFEAITTISDGPATPWLASSSLQSVPPEGGETKALAAASSSKDKDKEKEKDADKGKDRSRKHRKHRESSSKTLELTAADSPSTKSKKDRKDDKEKDREERRKHRKEHRSDKGKDKDHDKEKEKEKEKAPSSASSARAGEVSSDGEKPPVSPREAFADANPPPVETAVEKFVAPSETDNDTIVKGSSSRRSSSRHRGGRSSRGSPSAARGPVDDVADDASSIPGDETVAEVAAEFEQMQAIERRMRRKEKARRMLERAAREEGADLISPRSLSPRSMSPRAMSPRARSPRALSPRARSPRNAPLPPSVTGRTSPRSSPQRKVITVRDLWAATRTPSPRADPHWEEDNEQDPWEQPPPGTALAPMWPQYNPWAAYAQAGPGSYPWAPPPAPGAAGPPGAPPAWAAYYRPKSSTSPRRQRNQNMSWFY